MAANQCTKPSTLIDSYPLGYTCDRRYFYTSLETADIILRNCGSGDKKESDLSVFFTLKKNNADMED